MLLTGTEATAPGVNNLTNIENVIGGEGADTLIGGDLPNSLVGGRGNDTILGGAGDDTIIWNNGDGSDLVDGEAGVDTQQVNGGSADETFEIGAGTGGRLLFSRVTPGPFSLDIGTVENLDLNAGLGTDTVTIDDLTGVDDLVAIDIDGEFDNDTIDASALLAGPVLATLRGGPGNDSIVGSFGNDTIFGGQGNDTILGGPGMDTIEAGITAENALFAAVTSDNTALIFTADATTLVNTVTFTGLEVGETVIGADFRTNEDLDVLYLITDQGRIYTSTPAGEVTLLSTLIADPNDTTNPFTGLDGTDFGVDFNPVADRLRVVSNTGQDLRINVETGVTITDGDLAFATGDVNSAETPFVVVAAYTNSFLGTTSTTLYDIDSMLDVLLTQVPPNSGTLNTIGGLGVDAAPQLGFDILPGSEQTAFATLSVSGVTSLYRIDLMSGTATLIGTVGDGTAPIVGLAAAPDNDTIIWNNGDGSDIVDGGLGQDVQQVNGSGSDENFLITDGMGGRINFQRTSPGPFTLDIGTVESIQVFAVGGDDVVDASGLTSTFPITADGGDGNDTLIGGPGNDVLNGAAGNNRIVGNAGTNMIASGRVNPADYDGDGITDFATYSFSENAGVGTFEIKLSTTGQTISARLGGPNAFPVTGDYDGDGLTDIAVYEFSQTTGAGQFTIIDSLTGTMRTVVFGGPNDFPISGDYDGDGLTDIAVYGFSSLEGFSRFGVIPSTTNSAYSRPFGGPNDFPVSGDYDSDGRTDIAVYGFSPDNGFSRFGVSPSSQNDLTYSQGIGGFLVAFGGVDDSPVSADYNGDGQTDFVVYGPTDSVNRFAILPEVGERRAVPFGALTDLAVGADYNGDGITNIAVFGPGTGTGDDTATARFRYQVTEGEMWSSSRSAA